MNILGITSNLRYEKIMSKNISYSIHYPDYVILQKHPLTDEAHGLTLIVIYPYFEDANTFRPEYDHSWVKFICKTEDAKRFMKQWQEVTFDAEV